MLNSMWSGVSGLRTHQTKMDVIGNDIANVNTIAFKQSNVTFQDAIYKSLTSPGEGTTGKQIGLGVSVGKISKDFGGGNLQSTGVESHMALTGDGFFVLKDTSGENVTYTRAGNFELVPYGTNQQALMGPNGKYLYGTDNGVGGSAGDIIAIPSNVSELTIDANGVVSYYDNTGSPPVGLVPNAYTVDIATFAGQSGLLQVGGNQYAATTASGTAQFGSNDTQIVQRHLENSNVDLAKEFTEMIVAERGFQANSRTITTSDSMLQELMNLKR